MNNDISILNILIEASLVVQLIMLLLLLTSLISWTVILLKNSELNRTQKQASQFEQMLLEEGLSLTQSFAPPKLHSTASALERMHDASYHEYWRCQALKTNPLTTSNNVERSTRIILTQETEKLEQRLNFLATVGSVAPYIGLFGTVWGIMHTFLSLSSNTNVTLAVIAPGIAEALIATAIGLLVAIPAVIAYNRFVDRIERLSNQYENIQDQLLNHINHLNASKTGTA